MSLPPESGGNGGRLWKPWKYRRWGRDADEKVCFSRPSFIVYYIAGMYGSPALMVLRETSCEQICAEIQDFRTEKWIVNSI